MPTGAIQDHDDALIHMASGNFVEEYLHACRVDLRQDEAIEFASAHVHCAVGIGVFVRQHGLTHRAHGFGCPASARIANAAKTCFVLDHQLERLVLRPGFADAVEDVGEFFFHASCARGSL